MQGRLVLVSDFSKKIIVVVVLSRCHLLLKDTAQPLTDFDHTHKMCSSVCSLWFVALCDNMSAHCRSGDDA